MKPLFTVHAGEYLVGTHIEKQFRKLNVWVPVKDVGIDLLVTDQKNKNTLSLQVKFSKDFLVSDMSDVFQSGLRACGWWTLNREKIKKSQADFWVFVLQSFMEKSHHYIVVNPLELLRKLTELHGSINTLQTYLWVTKSDKCWEARGLKKRDQVLIANDVFKDSQRDFTKYLNDWSELKKLNRKR